MSLVKKNSAESIVERSVAFKPANDLQVYRCSMRTRLMTVPLGFLGAVALLPIGIWAIPAYAVSFNLDALMLRVTQQADAIEYRGFCKRRRLAYADIAGLETRTFFRLWPWLIIWPKQAGLKKIVMPALFERDAALAAWIAQWPITRP